MDLETAKQAREESVKSLAKQLEDQTRKVEQLITEGNERQLELNSLRAQNNLLSELQSRASTLERHPVPSINEASLHSTTVSMAVHDLSTCSLPQQSVGYEPRSSVGVVDQSVVQSSARCTPGLSLTSYGAPLSTVRTMLAARELTGYTAGLNVSASEFLFPHGSAYGVRSSYKSSVPSLIPMTSMSSVGLLPSSSSACSLLMVSGPFLSLLLPVRPTSQPLDYYEFFPISFQVPPVMKYDGISEAEPFEEWLEQFELVVSVCH